jgi:hypothetical protein
MGHHSAILRRWSVAVLSAFGAQTKNFCALFGLPIAALQAVLSS